MSGRGKGVRRKTRSSPYETQWDCNNPSNWTINKLKEELNKKGIRTPTGMSKLVLKQLYIENSSEGVTPIETQQTENFADNEINTDSPPESIVLITMTESVHQQRSSVSNGENENGGTDKNKTAESQNIAQCFAGLQETFKLLTEIILMTKVENLTFNSGMTMQGLAIGVKPTLLSVEITKYKEIQRMHLSSQEHKLEIFHVECVLMNTLMWT
ncbi:unnamed protein product [Mytilus coruscus]|uniref:Uncharacterized protein n=1 Tax=Mytilus coruscus TaxID=42192 RepID=A0A6J8EUB1_MYTCO|nr:unnamed protein product [Mytilus coruscus]